MIFIIFGNEIYTELCIKFQLLINNSIFFKFKNQINLEIILEIWNFNKFIAIKLKVKDKNKNQLIIVYSQFV
jgi:hypothetical protein